MARKREDRPRRLNDWALAGLGIMAAHFEKIEKDGFAKHGYIEQDVEKIQRGVRWIRFMQEKRGGENDAGK